MTAWILHPAHGYDPELAPEREPWRRWHPHRTSTTIGSIRAGHTVIPRFRAIPFGRELQHDIELRGAELINTWAQHRFAADLGQWLPHFSDITPTTWDSPLAVPFSHQGPFIVKGETTSRRQLWHTHFYAADRDRIGPVIANLSADSLIGHQRLYIREYVPLRHWGHDIVGVPIAEEYRIFFLDSEPVGTGFYWVNHAADLRDRGIIPDPARIPTSLIATIGARLDGHIRFASVDVAATSGGDWIVIEINDGSMSGICGVDPDELYRNLADRI